MERIILHCDLNNFYASAECARNPALKGKPLAVGGNEKDRHGIILAKSTEARKFGIKTGDKISEAYCKCKDLTVLNPDFDLYLNFSKQVRKIYSEYTDMIEPFGIDEAWLDVTGSVRVFGNGETIANEIRERIKSEIGLTISVGVSFCKSFAKLGSDMKKPDAVTVISKENFKDKIWCLPIGALLFAGRSTVKILNKYGIYTIGEFANSSPDFAKKILGKSGYDLWIVANGIDNSAVAYYGEKSPIKSIGRGSTCIDNLKDNEEVFRVIRELSFEVSEKLISERLEANSLQLTIKTEDLEIRAYSSHFVFPTDNEKEICENAFNLFKKNFEWTKNIRSVTVRTFNLAGYKNPHQTELGYNMERREKLTFEENARIELKEKYGKNAVFSAERLKGTKIPSNKPEYSVLPTAF